MGNLHRWPTLHPNDFEDDVDNTETIRVQQEGKPRYLPDKDEFLRYFDFGHREPEKPYADLKTYILKQKLRTEEGLDGIDGDLLTLHEMIQDGAPHTALIEYFTEVGYVFDGLDQVNCFL